MDINNPNLDPFAGSNINFSDDMSKNEAKFVENESCDSPRLHLKQLSAMVRRMPDMTARLQECEKCRNKRGEIIKAVASEIVKSADGNLVVPSYDYKMNSRQTVYIYTGQCWQIVDSQLVHDFIKNSCKAAGVSEDDYEDPTFADNLIGNVLHRVSGARYFTIPNGEAWINLFNGTLEIKANGEQNFRPHNRDDFFTYVLPYVYDPQADCPLWEGFLNQMLPEKDAQAVLAEYIGYCFAPGVNAEKMLVLYGSGSNGKSVVMSICEKLFGKSNVSNVSLSELTSNDEKRALIENKVANISHENDKEIEPSYMKAIVSGEPITVRVLYKGSHTMRNYAKLISSFNIMPLAENTGGFYRRFLILKWKVTISDKEADTDLANKLTAELPGILNWVLSYLPEFLKRRKFIDSPTCDAALAKYKLQSDNVRMFLAEKCKINYSVGTKAKEIYDEYRKFCSEEGLKYSSRNKFYDRLENIGCVASEYQGIKCFNIELKKDENSPL